jgi:hypothetical protein
LTYADELLALNSSTNSGTPSARATDQLGADQLSQSLVDFAHRRQTVEPGQQRGLQAMRSAAPGFGGDRQHLIGGRS